MNQERLARILIILLLGVAIGIPVAGWLQRSREIVIHGRMAETGGWTPENLTVAAGQTLHLRLTSDDVTHSFAVGHSGQLPVEVIPGEVTEVTLMFDRPGKYTFYCTRWCSLNHWRMRGTIEVTASRGGDSSSSPEPASQPLYVTLGLDIDSTHQAEVVPLQAPSAQRGLLLSLALPAIYRSRDYYLTHTPVDLWKALRAEPEFERLADQDVWDLVAWVWRSNTTSQELEVGRQLYAANCAACHGERGDGNGVFAGELAQPMPDEHAAMPPGETTVKPADFTDPTTMLSASPAHLQGKILRGGMGTGMPYWGPIFTENQTWALVAYLWTFQFELEVKP